MFFAIKCVYRYLSLFRLILCLDFVTLLHEIGTTRTYHHHTSVYQIKNGSYRLLLRKQKYRMN